MQRHPYTHFLSTEQDNEQSVPVFWGLVLARKNSKRLPGKTMRPLAGKPMISHTFEAAKNSRHLNDTWLYTDDDKAISLAQDYDIRIPTHPRTDEVSRDNSCTEETIRAFLTQFPVDHLPDYIVLLQATSPLRNSQDIDKAIETLLSHVSFHIDGLISIYQPQKPLEWLYEHHPDTLTLTPIHYDTTHWKMPNGAIYIFKPQDLLEGKAFMSGNIVGFNMPWQRSVDIDTIEDFLLAEALLQQHSTESTLKL